MASGIENELEAARRVAAALGIKRHAVLHIDLAQFGHSALTADIPVPKERSADAMSHGIPVTYVPARNTVFLSLALAYAETLPAADIFLGVNAVDYSGYPDCRPEYHRGLRADGQPGDQGRRRGYAEVQDSHAADSIDQGPDHSPRHELGVDYGLTHSCYDPERRGATLWHCDACQLRSRGLPRRA